MASNFPPVPVSFRPIQHYLKTAQEHEERDLVVCYWSRLYALQVGLKLSSQKADEQQLLIGKCASLILCPCIFDSLICLGSD